VLEQPQHPYARASLPQIETALRAFQSLCAGAGYPLPGTLERNWLLPSAAGAFRPTCLAPETMIAGDLRSDAPMLLVGFEGYHDFYPHFAAANLSAQGIPTEALMLDLPSLRSRRRVDTMVLARLFDKPEFRAEVAEALKPQLGEAARVGFPAVLGVQDALRAARELASALGRRVFEMPGLPPSVPGMRLQRVFVRAIRQAGGRIHDGIEVIEAAENGAPRSAIRAVLSKSAARLTPHAARYFVLATGGILGGGMSALQRGDVQENIFRLPVKAPRRGEWLQRAFTHPDGHAIFGAGVRVDKNFRTDYPNMWAVGGLLGGADFVRQQALEGVALVSAFRAVEEILTGCEPALS